MTKATIAPSSRRLFRPDLLVVPALLAVTLPFLAFLPRDVGLNLITQVSVVVLLVIAAMDYVTLKVPNIIVFPAIAFVLIGTGLVDTALLDTALLGAAATLGLMFLLAVLGRGLLGMGDVKVGCLIGAVLGWLPGLVALGLGFMFGAVAAIFLVIVGFKGRKDSLPLTPFLAAGAIAMILFWDPLIDELTKPDPFA